MSKELKFCKTYHDIVNCPYRFSIHQGGTRSGKTFSIIQALVLLACEHQAFRRVMIVRKTMPSLRRTAYKEFINKILKPWNLYNVSNHNKSNDVYNLLGTEFEFIGLDDPAKAHGLEPDMVFINEANQLNFEDFQQLNQRCTGKMILDYNPTSEFWAHTEILEHPSRSKIAKLYKTCYIDNPFIDENVKAEILSWKDTDRNRWRVYGLGELGIAEGLVYPEFEIIDSFPEEEVKHSGYGLDIGYTYSPTALIRCGIHGQNLYLHQEVYSTRLTDDLLSQRMEKQNIDRNKTIVIDTGGGGALMAGGMKRRGWRLAPAYKPAGSKLRGIDLVKRFKIYVTKNSPDLIRELKNYKHHEDIKLNKFKDEPIKEFDHAMDAIRYWVVDQERRGNIPFKLGEQLSVANLRN